MVNSILLVGVGGQGTILASKLLTTGLMDAGYDVKMSEIHGMSQRGGSVSSHVRYGDERIASPVIELGGADILVSFEQMEALRALEYLKPGGRAIVNDFRIKPMPVASGKVPYPDDILPQLKANTQLTVIDAAGEAKRLGNPKVMNVILLGAIVKSMRLEAIDWAKIFRENVKASLLDLNLKAFDVGMRLA